MDSKLLSKSVTLDTLTEIISENRSQNKKIVWTNGCFDILHVGHVEYLAGAKQLGDILVVGLNNDKSVRQLKGADRPLFNQTERAKVLNAIEFVDYILIFEEPSPLNLLRRLKPDFYVKGGDYNIETINQDERRCIDNYGGKIAILPMIKGASTTKIIEKIYKLG